MRITSNTNRLSSCITYSRCQVVLRTSITHNPDRVSKRHTHNNGIDIAYSKANANFVVAYSNNSLKY